ncbi:hypothetical protein KAU11_07525 [Candidatus Babeliales bacterium]|nr:hypothetical protein [Candidatus Babeliales bacterium]
MNGNPPVTIGEWGTVKGDIHTPHRYNYALGLRDFYEDMDYSWSWWDDVGSFGLYDTITDTFDDSIKDALFYDDLPAFGTYDSTVIYQSDFSSDTDGWTTFTTGGGGLSLSVVDNELWCNVTSAGTGTADVRALSPSHLATKDAIYRVTYTIRGDKSFCADKINDNFSWHNITALDGGGTYSRVYTYWMAYYTDPSNQVSFLLGGDTDDIYIQNVLIEEITFDTPPEIDYTILWSEDFDDFAVQSTLNGDTLEAHIDNFESASSTGGDDTYETAGIVDFDGSHVIESRYPIGECCLEGNGWGSTGMDWRAHITAAKESDPNPPRRLVISMNIYLDPLFENSSGFKLPALCTEKGSGWDNFTMRMMIVKYGLGNDERDPQYYSHAYWGGYGSPVETGARSKTMQPLNYFPGGEWINVSYVVDAGTLLSNNAWTEFFINGEMIGDNTGRSNREDPIRGIDTGDAQGLTYIEFTTFMGGSDASYVSPRTQYMYIDDVIVYYLDDSGDYTYPSSEGDELYLPPEANWPR